MEYSGVTLQSCGQYWNAYWVNDRGEKTTKSLGPMKSLTRKQAEKKCRGISAGHAKSPGLRNATKSPTMGDWAERYIELRSDLAPSTLGLHLQTCRMLVEHFGEKVRLDKILRPMASDWRLQLEKRYHRLNDAGCVVGGESTVCKHCKIAKQIIKRAVENECVAVNVFDHLKSTPPVQDQSCRRFIDYDEMYLLLLSCPTPKWRRLFMLCYCAGLRRGEALRLEWSDIQWDKNRLIVRNHRGHVTSKDRQREVLVNGELMGYLLSSFERAEPGDTHVCGLWNQRNMVAKVVRSIVAITDIEPDGVTLQALRSPRDSIWHGIYPSFVCNAWLGHSESVAAKHYLTVPESCYEQGSQTGDYHDDF